MENDVDIYADLPSFDLNPEKNDQNCNCKELKKELGSLISKLENIEKVKANLERNLSSLLKTARTEIARKDKMISDLRKRLDDITFRRGNKTDAPGFFTHRLPHEHTVTRKYENVSPTHSHESEIESHQVQFCQEEYKNKKPQTEVNQISTLFGERLQKKIMETEKEEKKQKALLKLSVESKTKDIHKNNVVENNTENESQFSINNNNESVEQRSTSESLEKNSYRKYWMKRKNEEDNTCRHKRFKIENNEGTTTKEIDYNYFTRYDLTDNPVQHEMKNSLTKFEDQSNATHSFKKEEVPVHIERRAASEYRDMKHNQSYTNRWKNDSKIDAKNYSARDHDGSNVKNDRADSLRNSRISSTSSYVSEGFNSNYKKNGYRYSPPRRSYSRSRSDYESSHRLRERSSRTYREKKYDDYKYDSRYKNSRLKWNYESEENDGKTRYRRRERDRLREKSRYSSSDNEEKESNSSYKNKTYENHRLKKENVLNDKKLHESNKVAAETNSREFSSRIIVNNVTNIGKNIEQHQVINESEIEPKNSIESISPHVAMKNSNILANIRLLEEGEILDSPEKKRNFAKISKDDKMEENNVKSVPVEDKNENISISTDGKSTSFQNNANSTKQLEVADITTKKIEIALCLLQENSKNCEKVIQLNSSKNDMAVDKVYNCKKDEDTCKSYISEDLMDSIAENIGAIEQVHDTDIDGNDKNNVDKTSSKNFIIEIAETAKIEEMTASSIESITKIKEFEDPNSESATKKEEANNLNIESIEVTEANNFNNNSKIDGDELGTSRTAKVEAVLNCDIESRGKSEAPIESETLHQMSSKSNVEMCLNDHNYVQNPFTNVSDPDAIQKPFLRSECGESVPEPTSKKTQVERTINVQSINSAKRTVSSSTVKKKKDQQGKGILISHRRKAVTLSDSNASMTVLMNTNAAKTFSVADERDDDDSALKPRACKKLRVKLMHCKNM